MLLDVRAAFRSWRPRLCLRLVALRAITVTVTAAHMPTSKTRPSAMLKPWLKLSSAGSMAPTYSCGAAERLGDAAGV